MLSGALESAAFTPNKQNSLFFTLCVHYSASTTHTHTQQRVRPVPERRGLLLHQDLLRDSGRQLFSSPFPAGSGPGLVLSSQLDLLRFSSCLRSPDPTGSQAQVQLQLWAQPEQAQSAQPVRSQQLLADPLRAPLSGGCSSAVLAL